MKPKELAAKECLYELKLNPDYRDWSFSDVIEQSFLSGVEYAQQWMSVDFEQPPQIGWYLCKLINQDIPEVCHCHIYKGKKSLNHDWNKNVTHWQQTKLI